MKFFIPQILSLLLFSTPAYAGCEHGGPCAGPLYDINNIQAPFFTLRALEIILMVVLLLTTTALAYLKIKGPPQGKLKYLINPILVVGLMFVFLVLLAFLAGLLFLAVMFAFRHYQ